MAEQKIRKNGIIIGMKNLVINVGVFVAALFITYLLLNSIGMVSKPIGQAELNQTNRTITQLESKIEKINEESVKYERKKLIDSLEKKKVQLSKDVEALKSNIDKQKLKLQ